MELLTKSGLLTKRLLYFDKLFVYTISTFNNMFIELKCAEKIL